MALDPRIGFIGLTTCVRETDLRGFCELLRIGISDWQTTLREKSYIYVNKLARDGKRQLCYPRLGSRLYRMQKHVLRSLLRHLPLVDEVCGYRQESHNILVCEGISGAPYVGTLDISKFHPSIKVGHVIEALRRKGFSYPNARRLAELVTYGDRLPQGAPTSNHVANLVMEMMLRRRVLPYCKSRQVVVRNYGDDVAFVGQHANAVRACVAHAARAFGDHGFTTNDKGRVSEHRGARRRFVGCCTGRDRPDYPRSAFRSFRTELRAILAELRASADGAVHRRVRSQLHSYRQRIVYVKRLSRNKARILMELFHRIRAAVRGDERSVVAA